MKKDNKYGIKYRDMWNTFIMPCPGCKEKYIEFQNNGNIEVNCESRRLVKIEGMLTLIQGCSNPFCEWSKIEEGD